MVSVIYCRDDDPDPGCVDSTFLYLGKLGIMNNYPVLILLYSAFVFL